MAVNFDRPVTGICASYETRGMPIYDDEIDDVISDILELADQHNISYEFKRGYIENSIGNDDITYQYDLFLEFYYVGDLDQMFSIIVDILEEYGQIVLDIEEYEWDETKSGRW